MADTVKKPVKKRRTSLIFLLIMIVLLGVLSYSLYRFFSEYVPQQKEQLRFAELRSLIEDDEDEEEFDPSDPSSTPDEKKGSKYRKLFAMNADMRGWLKITDTQIDYPVMKSELDDGEYYLHRDFDGYYSFAGCLFIGSGCDEDSDSFVIYGHNMNNGSMFGELDSYAYYDYAEEHRYIIFDTKDEYRVYKVFAAFSTQIYEKDSTEFKYYEAIGDFDDEQYYSAVNDMMCLSYIDFGDYPEDRPQIMMLSTCAYHTDEGRFVVAAYRIK